MTEFSVEGIGFNAAEKRKLATLWSRLSFSPEFCANFSPQVHKGDPGEPGIISIEAKDLHFFRGHWTVELGFTDLVNLIELSSTCVERACVSWETSANVARS